MATLLETVFRLDGTPGQVEAEVRRRLESGALQLSGNFRGQEQQILGRPEGLRWLAGAPEAG